MDIVERLRKPVNEKEDYFISQWPNEEPHTKDVVRFEAADEIERLRGALRTIDGLIPKTKEITDFPYWAAIAGDIAEGALNGTWPAYGVMPAPAKEKE